MDAAPSNVPFDPYEQVISLVNPNGVDATAVHLSTVFNLQQVVLEMAAVYGVHLGITTVLILLLALLTKADKRRSVVFALNMAALVAFWLRAILMLANAGGPLMNYYIWCLGLYDQVGNAFDISIASEIIAVVSLAAVELSLLFQVRIVCCTLQRRYRFFIALGSVAIVFIVVAVRFAVAVLNIMWFMHAGGSSEARVATFNKVQTGGTIATLCSILIFSVAFCTKLGYAIYQRRKMGMTQFGPMQIIFVMGCQTLLIPTLFGVISFFYLRNSQIYSIMPLLVAVFLPLSAIWASTNTTKNINIAAPYQWRKQNLRKSTIAGSSDNNYTNEKGHLTSNSTTDGTLVDERAESFSGASPSSKKAGMGHQATLSRDSIDLELQKGAHGIHIDRTYSVRSE